MGAWVPALAVSPGAASGGSMKPAGGTMRASFYQGARSFTPGTAPVPVPGPGEALLRVRRVGPLAVATHDVRRAAVKAGDATLVFGGGPIGTLIALVARQYGARVVVSEVNPFRVDMLQKLGLQTVGPGTDLVAFVNDWTNG